MAHFFSPNSQESDGSLAYKTGETLIVQPRPTLRPLTSQRRRHFLPRETLHTAPFTVWGSIAVFLCALAVVGASVQLHLQSVELSRLSGTIDALTAEHTALTAKYNAIYSDEVVAQAASAFGMQLPGENQMVYVDLSLPDKATVYPEKSPVEELLDRLSRDAQLLTGGAPSVLK